MAVFTLNLSSEHRALLEAYRARHGLRSEAEAVRHMLDALASAPSEAKPALAKPAPSPAQRVIEGAKIPFVKPPETAEVSKPFKSRLKGQWKAP